MAPYVKIYPENYFYVADLGCRVRFLSIVKSEKTTALNQDQAKWVNHMERVIVEKQERDPEKWLDKRFNFGRTEPVEGFPHPDNATEVMKDANILQALLFYYMNLHSQIYPDYYPRDYTMENLLPRPTNVVYPQINVFVQAGMDLNELGGIADINWPCPFRQYKSTMYVSGLRCRYDVCALQQTCGIFPHLVINMWFPSRYCYDEKISVRVSILSYALLTEKYEDFLKICCLKEPQHKSLSSLIKSVYKPSKAEIKLLVLMRNVPFFYVDQLGDIMSREFDAMDVFSLRMELACHVGYFCKHMLKLKI